MLTYWPSQTNTYFAIDAVRHLSPHPTALADFWRYLNCYWRYNMDEFLSEMSELIAEHGRLVEGWTGLSAIEKTQQQEQYSRRLKYLADRITELLRRHGKL